MQTVIGIGNSGVRVARALQEAFKCTLLSFPSSPDKADKTTVQILPENKNPILLEKEFNLSPFPITDGRTYVCINANSRTSAISLILLEYLSTKIDPKKISVLLFFSDMQNLLSESEKK